MSFLNMSWCVVHSLQYTAKSKVTCHFTMCLQCTCQSTRANSHIRVARKLNSVSHNQCRSDQSHIQIMHVPNLHRWTDIRPSIHRLYTYFQASRFISRTPFPSYVGCKLLACRHIPAVYVEFVKYVLGSVEKLLYARSEIRERGRM